MIIHKKYNINTKILLKHIKQNLDRQITIIIRENDYNYLIIKNYYISLGGGNTTIGYEIISDDVLTEIIHCLQEDNYYFHYTTNTDLIKECDIIIRKTDYNDPNTTGTLKELKDELKEYIVT